MSRNKLSCIINPFFLIFPFFFVVFSVLGQQAEKWHTIVSESKEFSISLPGELLVLRNPETKGVTILAGSENASFRVEFGRSAPIKLDLKEARKDSKQKDVKESNVKNPNADVQSNVYERPKVWSANYSIATGEGLYFLNLSTRDGNDKVAIAVLASVRVKNSLVFTNISVQLPIPVDTLNVEKLENSPIITETLKNKSKSKIEVDRKENPSLEIDNLSVFYSRPPFRVNKLRPEYPDTARENHINGTVKLRILYRANGEIGKISVVKGVGGGLTDQVINAAKQIIFLPAMLDGKAVDAELMLEYTFLMGQ